MDNNPDQPQPTDPLQPVSQPIQPNLEQPQQPQPMQQPQNFGPQQQPVQQQQYQQPQQEHQTDTLGIISIIMAFFIPFVGFILGLVGRSKAKKGGYSGTLSLVGIIMNAVFMVIGLLVAVFFVLASFQGAQTVGRDIESQSNVNTIYQKLEEFYNNNGYYPEDITSEDLLGIDYAAVEAVNTESRYNYSPSGCSQAKCPHYTISVELEIADRYGDNTYEKRSLN
jgi:hypothetical protein